MKRKNSKIDKTDERTRKIVKFLIENGFRPNVMGFEMMVRAIELCKDSKECRRYITSVLAGHLAEEFEVEPQSAMKSLRFVLTTSNGIYKDIKLKDFLLSIIWEV